MPPRRKGGFFGQATRPEDEAARQREVAALIAPRRTVVQDLPIERIRPNPFQARVEFVDLEELAEAIKAQGFTTRLRVRADPNEAGFFQLVFGERRLRAAALAGLHEVPCEIADHTDEELIEIGLAENIQRRDLAPLEEARAFRLFIEQRGYSIRRLAERLGKDKSYVEDRLKLLQVPDDVQEMVAQRPDALRAAREIARLESKEAREPLIAGVLAGDLSTAAVREIVRDVSPPSRASVARQSEQADIASQLRRDLRTVRSILARWAHLAEQDDDGGTLVAEHCELLFKDLQRLLDEL